MDYRKKNIAELERSKRETLHSLDLILEDLGCRLMERLAGMDTPPEACLLSADAEEYRRLQHEAADSEGLIKGIEKDSLRLQTIDEGLEQKEDQRAARLQELSAQYRHAGKLALENPQYAEPAAFFRQRADSLVSRVESLEARLTEPGMNGGAHVFAWIGKSARALMVRSQLAKARDDLAGLYEAAGEEFTRPAAEAPPPPEGTPAGPPPPPVNESGLLEDIERIRGQVRDLEEDMAKLREERRTISAAFNTKGGPVRHIQDLEKQKSRVKQALKTLYRRFGGEAADSADFRTGSAGSKRFAFLFNDDDQQTLEKIRVIRKTVEDYDGEIEKLKASLAVDEQKAEIAKLEKAVAEQRDRIAAAEDAIAGYNRRMEDARARIEELSVKL
jgi:DNA repair exonuclease SbcCD ATPase subunit